MTDAPLFSVVIPCFNRAASIGPVLQSVIAQTFADFECIVVDDGSSDGQDLAEVVANLGDIRFRYVRRDNGGGGAARNTGIDAARGAYIAFLDSDDRFLPHKLERFASVVGGDPQRACYAPALVDRGVKRMWQRPRRAIGSNEDMGEYLFVANQFIQTSTIVLPTETARRIRFDPALRKGQDLDFCIRLHAAGVRFSMLDEPLSIWTDTSEVSRTSRQAGHAAPTLWLASMASVLTSRAICGYRATVLAYYLVPDHRLRAARFLLAGLLAGVPPHIIARQCARCFMPRGLYRRFVNACIALSGTPASKVATSGKADGRA
jgi:glycosyltransferase involved in cell wall biosynthesis